MLDDSEMRLKRARRTASTYRWRKKHRDSYMAYQRKYRKCPKSRAREKAYYTANREHINAQRRAHRQANLEATRAKARDQRRRQRERDKARMAADPAYVPIRTVKGREYQRKWRAANREKCREYERRREQKEANVRAPNDPLT